MLLRIPAAPLLPLLPGDEILPGQGGAAAGPGVDDVVVAVGTDTLEPETAFANDGVLDDASSLLDFF